MQSPTARRSLLNLAGVIILLAGTGIGGFIYWRTIQGGNNNPALDDGDTLLSPDDNRRYDRDLEMNSGKVGVLVDQWMRAAAKLGQPRPLAITITVLSILGAGGCFIVAARLPGG